MCMNPRYIRNKTLVGNAFTRYIIPVGCGECEQCRAQKQQEWFLRNYHEHVYNEKSGGITVFYTLTFRDRCLPKISFLHGNNRVTLPAFSREKVTRFKTLVEDRIRHRCGVAPRYFIVSEFGDETKRSHHHGLHYLPKEYVQSFDSEIECLRHFRQVLYECWPYGFVGYSMPKFIPKEYTFLPDNEAKILYGMKVHNDSAIKYASKYVTKDVSWYDQDEELSSFLESCKNGSSPSMREYADERKPFHMQSAGIGYAFVRDILENTPHFEDILPYFIKGVKITDIDEGKVKSYPLPQSYVDKLLYVRDPGKNSISSGHRRLTELGIKIKNAVFLHNAQYVQQTISHYSSALILNSFLKKNDLDYISKVYPWCDSPIHISDFVHSILDGREFDYAVYHSVYKGRYYHVNQTIDGVKFSEVFENFNDKEFYDFTCKVVDKSLHPEVGDSLYGASEDGYFSLFNVKREVKDFTHDPYQMDGKSRFLKGSFDRMMSSYDHFSRFQDFDYIDNLFNMLTICKFKKLFAEYNQKYKVDKELKNYFGLVC